MIENKIAVNGNIIPLYPAYNKKQASSMSYVMQAKRENIDGLNFKIMPSPIQIQTETPLSKLAVETVSHGRNAIKNILDRHDPRFIVIVGPCSIHDPVAGLDYAKRLALLADELSDTFCIIMRAYLEKPRTTVGWKGFLNDPYLDGSSSIEMGIRKARKFLLQVNELGLPVATETLSPNVLPYLRDLVSWTAIGARTAESQIHREISSGFNAPVGFKNGTSGALDIAINAVISASKAHSFLSIDEDGYSAIASTTGNAYGHLILRGGGGKPNYKREHIIMAEQILAKNKLPANIIVDCSHDNSSKDYTLQPAVLSNIVQQICQGNHSIVGAMLESNIEAGNQPIQKQLSALKYGCSITDACIDWTTTENILRKARENLKGVLLKRN